MKGMFKIFRSILHYLFWSTSIATSVTQSKQHFSEEKKMKEFGVDLLYELG